MLKVKKSIAMRNVNRKTGRSGFTLVEILIVVALIAILAVAALVAINPAEAQRKARDSDRIRDMGTLQTILEQYITDNTVAAAIDRTSTNASSSNNCGTTGWLGVDVCTYALTVPLDPVNASAQMATSASGSSSNLAAYEVHVDVTEQYRICTRFESRSNVGQYSADGGSSTVKMEVYNSTTAPTCT